MDVKLQDQQTLVMIILVLVAILVVGFFIIIFANYFRLYIQCVASRAGIGLVDLVGMSLRKVRADTIVRARIMAVQSGLDDLTRRDLETHMLAGGNVPRVVRAVISANRANLKLGFREAAAIDLAGRNVEEAVRTSVDPKVIDVPDPSKGGKMTLDAVAKDGIQLRVRARVTVRTNLEQLIGGATEDTIIARVGEGIVSTIGSAETYKKVLEHPDEISKKVLGSGQLSAGTAFQVLSIDIADIDVGENVGARLQADQAEADMRRARAEAEAQRAQAEAQEQEMIALVMENRAKLVKAEAEVPQAIADAFRSGQVDRILGSTENNGATLKPSV